VQILLPLRKVWNGFSPRLGVGCLHVICSCVLSLVDEVIDLLLLIKENLLALSKSQLIIKLVD